MVQSKLSKYLVYVLVLAISLMVAAQAGADSKTYSNYTRVGIGANEPTDDLDDADYDAGVNASVAYGRYLGRYMIIEGGASWFYTDEEFRGSTATAGTYERDDVLDVSSLTITIKGEMPAGKLRLFAGGGFGVYFASLNAEIETQNLGDFDADDNDTVFGAHVVAGGSYDITPQIFVGIEGLYRWTDDVDLRETVGTVPMNYQGNLDGFALTFSGGFRF